MSFVALAVFAGGLVIASMLVTRVVLVYLRRKAILDMPNHRSSHAVPTPRGGGLAVTPLLLVMAGGVFVWAETGDIGRWVMLAAAAGLAMISWLDDRRDLPARARFLCQIIAVSCGLLAISGPVLQGLVPLWLDHVLVALAWIWFINLFNFMDGIDGISGVEAGSIGMGLFILMLLAPMAGFVDLGIVGLGVVAIMLGFLMWNWHPAKLFMGDVGSVPLGFVLGWLLLELAARGMWIPALILPSYYLVDATFTLIRRALRGEKIWQAHRQHFYQRATQRGLGHAQVSTLILIGNLALVMVVFVPLPDPSPLLRVGLACLVVGGMVAALLWLPLPRKGMRHPSGD
ncbi:MAG: glycosyltransferase family 4 protein [Pseudomonadota bacterium]